MSNLKTPATDKTMEYHLHECRLKIGETIKEIREKRGYSQEQLAEIMQISRSTISKIENGKFSFSIDYLSKFSWSLEFEFKIIDISQKNYII